MKSVLLILVVFVQSFSFAQDKKPSEVFWNNLLKHCGNSYEGTITAGGKEGDGFVGEKLVMHVISCNKNEIRIPFHVGNDHSRTWVITKNKKGILTLKHDHRHKDGSEDEVTQYGGTAPNVGKSDIQFFPADAYTYNMIDYAFSNIWWLTLNDLNFSYNLMKVGSDRKFTVVFDLTEAVETPPNPWGYKK
nr:hypothetical protein [uncultured Flavobacterium sp.]